MPKQILVVDDDTTFREFVVEVLQRKNYLVDAAENGLRAVEYMESKNYDLIVSDIRMPGMGGIQVFEKASKLQPEARVIMLTAYASLEDAVELMHRGAFYYIEKPCDPDRLEILVQRALENQQLQVENKQLRTELKVRYDFGNMVGKSKTIQEIFEHVATVAKSRSTVLIQGQSGTGKELIARAIHYNSPRVNGPFIKLNCAALPQDLIESELFGHEKGAFTDAHRTRAGKFELAHGGTLFLDEIGDMSLPAQAKVLRALQEQKIQRVGSDKDIKVDVRVLAATNKNLLQEIAEGPFREDLYHRLAVILIDVPSLADPKEDIPLLVDYFAHKIAQEQGTSVKIFNKKSVQMLQLYPWTGNIRELRNVVERLIILGGEEITEQDVQAYAGKQ